MANTNEFKIFLTNLADYNNGVLNGKWVNMPCDIEEELQEIGCMNEEGEVVAEWFITDYENDWNYKVGEYESLEKLNELAERLEDLDDSDAEVVAAYMEAESNDLEEALDNYKNCIFWEGRDLKDLAYELADEEIACLGGSANEFLARYFDYDAYARDLRIDGYIETTGGVILIQ